MKNSICLFMVFNAMICFSQEITVHHEFDKTETKKILKLGIKMILGNQFDQFDVKRTF